MSEIDTMMLILFSHLFVNNNDDNIRYHDLDFLYEKRCWNRMRSYLNDGEHILLTEKMIEYNNDDGFVDRESFHMTVEAKRQLFAELNLSSLNQSKARGDMIKSEEIVPKSLFYGDKLSSQIEELGGLLDDVQYKQIRTRMKDSGFRCGFTCLFYGSAGTGKTETVLQLARQTGRDIMQVNISQIKSMWVGESEKNIKQVLRESDLVTLSIGLNDIIYKISITPDITDKKVNTIVDNVTLELNQLIVEINKYYPKKVYLIGYPDIPMENIYIKKGIKRLNRNMKEISNTVYINTEECIHHEDFLKSKSFYPSKYGYYKIYQELRKKLAK